MKGTIGNQVTISIDETTALNCQVNIILDLTKEELQTVLNKVKTEDGTININIG